MYHHTYVIPIRLHIVLHKFVVVYPHTTLLTHLFDYIGRQIVPAGSLDCQEKAKYDIQLLHQWQKLLVE